MTVTASLTGSPPTRSDTATAEDSSSNARRRSSSAGLSCAFGSSWSMRAWRLVAAVNKYPQWRSSAPREGATHAESPVQRARCARRSGIGSRRHEDRLAAMRIVYKLFAKITGGVAGRLGKGLFKSLWSLVDTTDEPPEATSLDAS